MSEVSLKRVFNERIHLFVAENQDGEGRSLDGVDVENLSKKLKALFGLEGFFLHDVEDVVEDSHRGGGLLVAVHLVFAEIIVHVVKVQFK